MNKPSLHAFIGRTSLQCGVKIRRQVLHNQPWSGMAVTDQLEIIFDTLRSTRKYRNLKARPACSVVWGFPRREDASTRREGDGARWRRANALSGGILFDLA